MIPIPVCFLSEMLAGKSEKDHGTHALFQQIQLRGANARHFRDRKM
jgi:hypothetical protein